MRVNLYVLIFIFMFVGESYAGECRGVFRHQLKLMNVAKVLSEGQVAYSSLSAGSNLEANLKKVVSNMPLGSEIDITHVSSHFIQHLVSVTHELFILKVDGVSIPYIELSTRSHGEAETISIYRVIQEDGTTLNGVGRDTNEIFTMKIKKLLFYSENSIF